MCFQVTRHHHDTRRILVESVHNASSRQLFELRIDIQQAIDQRTICMTRRWMHDKFIRFVYDKNIVVLMQYFELNQLRLVRQATDDGNVEIDQILAAFGKK